MPLIDESTLSALLDEARARVTQQKPRARRERGAVARALQSHGCGESVPPDVVAFDHLVALSPAEVPALFWLIGKAQRAGSLHQSDAMLLAAHRLIHHLMPTGEIDLIRGMWLLLHHAGIELDHAAISAQLSAQCGDEVGGLYLHEATHAAAMMLGAPAVIPSSDFVH